LPVEVHLAIWLLGAGWAALVAISGVVGFFLTRYWNKRDSKQRDETQKELARQKQEWESLEADRAALREQEWHSREAERAAQEAERAAIASQRASLREALIESLKWFEGDTQKRSIGISIVAASWDEFPELQPTWLGILANQAVYLLIVSSQGEKLHEVTNLRRILRILSREGSRLDEVARQSLRTALDERTSPVSEKRKGGVDVGAVELMDWWRDLTFNSGP
jgi:hypothetical protein